MLNALRLTKHGRRACFPHPSRSPNHGLHISGTFGTASALPNVNISAFTVEWINLRLVFLYWVDPNDKVCKFHDVGIMSS